MKNMDKNAGEGGQQTDGKGGGGGGKSTGNSGTGGAGGGGAHDPAALLDAASLFGKF